MKFKIGDILIKHPKLAKDFFIDKIKILGYDGEDYFVYSYYNKQKHTIFGEIIDYFFIKATKLSKLFYT